MAFGYDFIDLNEDQKLARRVALDTAGLVAQSSAVVVLLGFLLFRLVARAYARLVSGHGRDRESNAPGSPYVKHAKQTSALSPVRVRSKLRQLKWWVNGPAFGAAGWGTRGEWVVASVWTAWLLVCCVVNTSPDYLHLTKRFGIVAASQLPLHYLLAFKSPYSPIQLMTGASHEELNVYHRILGRIATTLFALHATFYLSFFTVAGFLPKRIKDRDVILGLIGLSLFSLVATTALGLLRRWNYRVFYYTHIIGATILLPVLYFHVHHIRLYIWETAGLYVLHAILRYVHTSTFEGTVSVIPDTDLIQVRIPLSPNSSAKSWSPGSHVYLSLPAQTRTDSSMDLIRQQFQKNPFTVASLPSQDKELLLIARIYGGNTKTLASIARKGAIPMPLALEGPYGAAFHLPDLTSFDRVLFVAGGSGASFVVPVWRDLVSKSQGLPQRPSGTTSPRLIWAVKKAEDSAWARSYLEDLDDHVVDEYEPQSANPAFEIYVTRKWAPTTASNPDADTDGVELQGLIDKSDALDDIPGVEVKEGRPNLAAIVDETLATAGAKTAVLVCGPDVMVKRLRNEVGRWVAAGKDVYWHAESFGL